MIQRQLYIYFVLVTSMVLNLFQLSAPPVVKETRALSEKPHSALIQGSAALKVPSVHPVVAPLVSKPAPVKEKYNIDIVMDYDRHFLTVEEVITYPNRTSTSLDSLTLAVAPNLVPDCFDLVRLAVNSIPVTD